MPNLRPDIQLEAAIRLLVDTFYHKVGPDAGDVLAGCRLFGPAVRSLVDG